MDRCDQIDDCSFFRTAIRDMPTVADMMKRKYCHGEFDSCARKVVLAAVGPGKAPPTLAPNDLDRARRIIDENR